MYLYYIELIILAKYSQVCGQVSNCTLLLNDDVFREGVPWIFWRGRMVLLTCYQALDFVVFLY